MAKNEQSAEPKTKDEAAGEFFVDGKAVSKEEYLKAAEKAGWNPAIMQEQGSYPAISTKKHGE